MRLELNTELFAIPEDGEYLVYAPLRGCIIRLKPALANILVRLRQNELRAGEAEGEFVRALIDAGIVNGPPETKPPTAVGQPYQPTRVTLLLTNRCNLRCAYCYAGDATVEQVMPQVYGRAAIDMLVANCQRKRGHEIEVAFHGGGEPTMAWPQLKSLVLYAQQAACKADLRVRLGLATNGCISRAKAEWIAAHFSHVNLSLDGPPEIQNRLRPTKTGRPTADQVRRTMQILAQAGIPFGVQATVTKDTVSSMPALVRLVASQTRPVLLKFEPVSDCGRFSGESVQVPSTGEFVHYFAEARLEGQRHRLPIGFSGVRLSGPRMSFFCGAFGEPFSVTPDGLVSACFEAFCGTAPEAGSFIFGRYDHDRSSFEFDFDKLERLRARNIYELEPCRRCFCKYSCAGDCATRNFRHFGSADLGRVGARCEAIREITRRQLSECAARQTLNPLTLEETSYAKSTIPTCL